MCPYCRANSVDRSRLWTDFFTEAGWRDTRFTHESYKYEYIHICICTYIALENGRLHLRMAGRAIPVLFLVVLGFRLEFVTIDVLHCVDKGVGSHIVGNIVWIIVVLRNSSGATFMRRG